MVTYLFNSRRSPHPVPAPAATPVYLKHLMKAGTFKFSQEMAVTDFLLNFWILCFT